MVAWIWSFIWHLPLDLIKWSMAYVLNEDGFRDRLHGRTPASIAEEQAAATPPAEGAPPTEGGRPSVGRTSLGRTSLGRTSLGRTSAGGRPNIGRTSVQVPCSSVEPRPSTLLCHNISHIFPAQIRLDSLITLHCPLGPGTSLSFLAWPC